VVNYIFFHVIHMIPNYNDIRYTYGEKSKVCVRTLYKEQSLEKKAKECPTSFFYIECLKYNYYQRFQYVIKRDTWFTKI